MRIHVPSLMTQPPIYAHEKGSGNIVYNELSQTLECGATKSDRFICN